ncbi:Serine/arginine-rich splicing factor SR45 [Penicillium atrosanguineum]|nr:Serine/arginine-rich splicing factor SR45 [Penicillium atrosanguineum]
MARRDLPCVHPSPPREDTRSPSPARGRPKSRSRSSSRGRSPSRSRSRGGRRYRSRSYSRTPSPKSPPRSAKIVVEKLTKNVTENHIREVFGSFGDIEYLDLPMNRSCETFFPRTWKASRLIFVLEHCVSNCVF